MQDYFYELSDAATEMLQPGEMFTSSFKSEDSDFVRFNKCKVRQAGSVSQKSLSVDLIEGSKHAGGTLTLSGQRESDRARLAGMLERLREMRAALPEDPHLLVSEEPQSSEVHAENRLPSGPDAMR